MSRWRCTAPFGLPVEPDEYSQKHSAIGPAGTAFRPVGAAAINGANTWPSPSSGIAMRGLLASTAGTASPANSGDQNTAAQPESWIM